MCSQSTQYVIIIIIIIIIISHLIDEQIAQDLIITSKYIPLFQSAPPLNATLIDNISLTALSQLPHQDLALAALQDNSYSSSMSAALPRESTDLTMLTTEQGKKVRKFFSTLYTHPPTRNQMFERLFCFGRIHEVRIMNDDDDDDDD